MGVQDPAFSDVRWETVWCCIAVPFAIFAVSIDHYKKLEDSRFTWARTVGFTASAVAAFVSLMLAMWVASDTFKVIATIYTAVIFGFGIRFSYIADRAEDKRERESKAREQKRDLRERRKTWRIVREGLLDIQIDIGEFLAEHNYPKLWTDEVHENEPHLNQSDIQNFHKRCMRPLMKIISLYSGNELNLSPLVAAANSSPTTLKAIQDIEVDIKAFIAERDRI